MQGLNQGKFFMDVEEEEGTHNKGTLPARTREPTGSEKVAEPPP